MKAETLEAIQAGMLKKGDVITTGQLAGVMAAKRTSELIPCATHLHYLIFR
jgi:cyclic pyranopterin phosphate synthase